MTSYSLFSTDCVVYFTQRTKGAGLPLVFSPGTRFCPSCWPGWPWCSGSGRGGIGPGSSTPPTPVSRTPGTGRHGSSPPSPPPFPSSADPWPIARNSTCKEFHYSSSHKLIPHLNKMPMDHIAHLKNQFKSINTFVQSYDYIS